MKTAAYLCMFRMVSAIMLSGLLWTCTVGAQENAQNRSLVYVHINEWWQKSSKEQIQVDPSIRAIGLRNGEMAYIATAIFPDRGRNGFDGALLIRPALKEVTDISQIIKKFEIKDLDDDGVSEIFTDVFGSGQGSTIGVKAVIQFDGWEPVFLRKIDYEDHGGAMIDKSKAVAWHTVDIAGTAALIEQIDISEEGKRTTTIVALRLEDGAFIPVRENIVIRWPRAKKPNAGKNVSAKRRLDTAFYSTNFNAVVKSYREASVKPELTFELAAAIKNAEQTSQDEKFNLRHGIATYTDILNKAPWWAPGYVRKAKLHAALGQYAQALAVARQYSQLEPNDPQLNEDVAKWKMLADTGSK